MLEDGIVFITMETNVQQGIVKPLTDKYEIFAFASAREQDKIGWTHMFQGRLSKKWTQAQREYLKSVPEIASVKHGIDKHIDTWRVSFLMSLIQFGLDLWEARNQNVHGKTTQDQRIIRRQKAIAKVKKLFSQGQDSVPSYQANLFKMHESNRIRSRTTQMERWIHVVEVAQGVHQANIKKQGKQQKLQALNFTVTQAQTPPQQLAQQVEEVPNHEDAPRKETSNTSRSTWVQQDMRVRLLNSNPNVRYRKSKS